MKWSTAREHVEKAAPKRPFTWKYNPESQIHIDVAEVDRADCSPENLNRHLCDFPYQIIVHSLAFTFQGFPFQSETSKTIGVDDCLGIIDQRKPINNQIYDCYGLMKHKRMRDVMTRDKWDYSKWDFPKKLTFTYWCRRIFDCKRERCYRAR